MKHAILVQQFIEQIWNQQSFEKLPYFLHPDFKDYSLPPSLAADPEGTKKWILNTSHSFTHHSIIEAQVTEGESSMVKIKMELRHTGHWRGWSLQVFPFILPVTGTLNLKMVKLLSTRRSWMENLSRKHLKQPHMDVLYKYNEALFRICSFQPLTLKA